MKGAEILIKTLIVEGVDTIFGYPGSSVLDIYEALSKYPEIRHVLTAHEQGAAHAADGYARSSGKVGVCLATSGPGATNLVTGIATAYMDSVPMVAITGNVSTTLLGKDSFQEVDIAGITMPITKHNFIIKDVKNLKDTVHRAFLIAKSKRPGPVLIDITTDAMAQEYEMTEAKHIVERPVELFSKEEIKSAAKLINASKRPLLYVGGGAVISDAAQSIKRLSDILNAPVCDSLMGKGAFPGNDIHYLGMLGNYGTAKAKEAVQKSDLIVAVGVRFSDRATQFVEENLKETKIIHIDIDPAEINKNVHAQAHLIGDAVCVINELIPFITNKERELWIAADKNDGYDENEFSYENIIRMIDKNTSEDTIVVTEVGKHQMTAVSTYTFTKPHTLLTSGGLGTMGYGLGAAIGAKTANPDKTVIDIAGDGCFRMNMNELTTAVSYKVPVIVFIFNNHSLKLVRELQEEQKKAGGEFTRLSADIDYVRVAEAMGAKGYKVNDMKQATEALKNALTFDVPTVIDCEI